MAKNPDQLNTFTAIDLVPIAPNDSTDLATNARSIRCIGAAGTLRITSIGLNEVLMVAASRVHATGTTATGLEAMI